METPPPPRLMGRPGRVRSHSPRSASCCRLRLMQAGTSTSHVHPPRGAPARYHQLLAWSHCHSRSQLCVLGPGLVLESSVSCDWSLGVAKTHRVIVHLLKLPPSHHSVALDEDNPESVNKGDCGTCDWTQVEGPTAGLCTYTRPPPVHHSLIRPSAHPLIHPSFNTHLLVQQTALHWVPLSKNKWARSCLPKDGGLGARVSKLWPCPPLPSFKEQQRKRGLCRSRTL